MSKLEATASRALTPLVLGTTGTIHESDCGPIAAWTHKTALINMLMTPDRDQARGEQLLGRELRSLYIASNQQLPVPNTQFWIGRYNGESRIASAWVTPMTVNVEGLPVPDEPQAYVMTLVVGAVLLQGIRFTTPLLEVDIKPIQMFSRLWPPLGLVDWPVGDAVDDESFLKVGKGLNLVVPGLPISLKAWKPATDLPDSEAEGDLVRLPTICGMHVVYYPGLLVAEAMRGVFYAFVASCECEKRYLVVTEHDGAHFKAEASGTVSPDDAVYRRYEALLGDEVVISGVDGDFVCKRLSG